MTKAASLENALPVEIQEVIDGFTSLTPTSTDTFDRFAQAVVSYQRERNEVYRRYDGFTYLPVQAFKLADVATFAPSEAERVFVSSGTAGQDRSRHYVRDLRLYNRSLLGAYDSMVGSKFGFELSAPVILGHLPAYADESSLVYMVNHLIEHRGADGSGLFLRDTAVLEAACRSQEAPVLLFGAAFGLLDLLEHHHWKLPPGSVVIETGGMKTHRRHIGRVELHDQISDGFGVDHQRVVSEYGMCELLSQCYTDERGIFRTPAWVRFEVLSPDDGRTPVPEGEPGALALLDLANVHTVSAVLTQDRVSARDGGFIIHGRLSEAELRGCNFLLEQ